MPAMDICYEIYEDVSSSGAAVVLLQCCSAEPNGASPAMPAQRRQLSTSPGPGPKLVRKQSSGLAFGRPPGQLGLD